MVKLWLVEILLLSAIFCDIVLGNALSTPDTSEPVIVTAAPASPCPHEGLQCEIYCELGFKKDELGCTLCECVPAVPTSLCENMACPDRKVCKEFYLTGEMKNVTRCVDPHIPTLCQMPRDAGPCRALVKQWWFNADTNQCEEFIYGGCKGNLNKFKDEYTCRSRCIPMDQSEPESKPEPEPCSNVMCMMYCDQGFERDSRGCEICRCKQRTKTAVTCSPVMCMMYCENGFEKNSDGCDICKCRPTETVVCTKISCTLFCEHGFETNSNGCEICRCKPAKSAETVTCPNQQCRMYCKNGFQTNSDGCEICACRPATVKCPPVRCMMHCENGFEQNADGCEICKCRPAPTNCPLYKCSANCPNGYVLDKNGCRTCTCKPENGVDCPKGKCRQSSVDCPDLQCQHSCHFGKKLDDNLCESCECLETPCLEKVCGEDFVCEAVHGENCTDDCPFTARCIDWSAVRRIYYQLRYMAKNAISLEKKKLLEVARSHLKKRFQVEEDFLQDVQVEIDENAVEVHFHILTRETLEIRENSKLFQEAVETKSDVTFIEYEDGVNNFSLQPEPESLQVQYYSTETIEDGALTETDTYDHMALVVVLVVIGTILLVSLVAACIIRATRKKDYGHVYYTKTPTSAA